jgi:hypothetical protein
LLMKVLGGSAITLLIVDVGVIRRVVFQVTCPLVHHETQWLPVPPGQHP